MQKQKQFGNGVQNKGVNGREICYQAMGLNDLSMFISIHMPCYSENGRTQKEREEVNTEAVRYLKTIK